MAAAQWFFWQLPAWLGSSALLWFVVVAAIAALSSWAPRRGGIKHRASSAAFHLMRTFSLFSYPSSCFNTWPDAFQGTEQPGTPRRSPTTAVVPEPETERDADGEGAMTMEEAYALAVAGREQPPPPPPTEVDVRAEEFIRGFEEDLRKKRLASIFNYTQMLKNRAAGRRPT